jgi:hypothetical protein
MSKEQGAMEEICGEISAFHWRYRKNEAFVASFKIIEQGGRRKEELGRRNRRKKYKKHALLFVKTGSLYIEGMRNEK